MSEGVISNTAVKKYKAWLTCWAYCGVTLVDCFLMLADTKPCATEVPTCLPGWALSLCICLQSTLTEPCSIRSSACGYIRLLSFSLCSLSVYGGFCCISGSRHAKVKALKRYRLVSCPFLRLGPHSLPLLQLVKLWLDSHCLGEVVADSQFTCCVTICPITANKD